MENKDLEDRNQNISNDDVTVQVLGDNKCTGEVNESVPTSATTNETLQEKAAPKEQKYMLTFNKGAYYDTELSNNATDKVGGIAPKIFEHLENEQKDKVLKSHNDIQQKEKDAGWLGKVFGANPSNASINTAAIICILAILVCVIDIGVGAYWRCGAINQDIWSKIIPVISLALGYIFGRGA